MRLLLLSGSVLATLLINACAEAPNDNASSSSVEIVDAKPEVATQNDSVINIDETQPPETKNAKAKPSTLPEKYQGLDPNEISRVEIEELISLNAPEKELRKAYQNELKSWREKPKSIRGPRPKFNPLIRNQEDTDRLQALNAKYDFAKIRKKYENLNPGILSESEIQEIILLEQEEAKASAELQRKFKDWFTADPATRGPEPEGKDLYGFIINPRLQELRGKVQNADEMERLSNRIEKLSATHNVSLSDSEIAEMGVLQNEAQEFEREFNRILMEVTQNGKIGEEEISEQDVLNAFPKQSLQRMFDVERRMDEIKAPIEAAERAERIRKEMTVLSQDSGVTILSSEIDETIALKAEKDRIRDKIERESIRIWLIEDGPIPMGDPLLNDEDYARLKEIDARLKAISAPMNDARNAALEADNPAQRQIRLEQERQQKWREDWNDRRQAGEFPPDAQIISPSYAELQDRVEDYRNKLTSRAERVGYTVPDTDLDRLEALNEEMMSIREKVYKMEVDGTSRTKKGIGYAPLTFSAETGMFKVRLIEAKQREILAGLSAAESPALETNENNRNAINHQRNGHMGAEFTIANLRNRGIDVSQAEADELIEFERSLKER